MAVGGWRGTRAGPGARRGRVRGGRSGSSGVACVGVGVGGTGTHTAADDCLECGGAGEVGRGRAGGAVAAATACASFFAAASCIRSCTCRSTQQQLLRRTKQEAQCTPYPPPPTHNTPPHSPPPHPPLSTCGRPAPRQQPERLLQPHGPGRVLPALVHEHAQLVVHGGVVGAQVVGLEPDVQNRRGAHES